MFNKFLKLLKKDKEDNKDKIKGLGKGLRPSPRDDRDLALSGTIPEIKRYPKEKPCPFDLRIHNQGVNPSCVGHSTSTIKEGMERKERVKIDFDGEWLYKECKKIDDFDGDGTYLRTALKVLKNKGVKPLDGDDDDVEKYKIEKYYRLDDISFEEIKKALSVYDFLLAGFKGSNKGWKGEVIRPPKDGEDEFGHAVALIGYEEDYIIGQNSWGDNSWVHEDSGGYFKVPKDYMPFEAWAITLDRPNEEDKSIEEEIRGWVAKKYTTVKDGKRVTTHNLNLREKPGTDQSIVETLPKGTKIKTDGDEEDKDGYTWVPVLE